MVRKVAVIMGSDSDWPVVKGACSQLKALGIPFEAHILSAHRTPAEAAAFAKSAKDNCGHLAFFGTPEQAREFFDTPTLEGVVRRINRPDEGGDGLSDYYIEKYGAMQN